MISAHVRAARHDQARRCLRREMTLPEVLLWRGCGSAVKADRCSAFGPVGPYVLDFFCGARLCLQVDGATHGRDEVARADESRDAWLGSNGVRVLGIAAADVLRDPDQVAAWIVEEARGTRTLLTTAMRERLGR